MNYIGKIYGKVGSKYFDTGKTTEDWETNELELAEARELLSSIIHHYNECEDLESLMKMGCKFLERTKK